MIVYSGLDRQRAPACQSRRVLADTSDIRMLRHAIRFAASSWPAPVPPACASSSAVPRPFPSPGAPSAPAPCPRSGLAPVPAELAGSWKLRWLCAGHPIAMAAATRPGSTAAASSGTSSRGTGSRVPRTVAEQFRAGRSRPPDGPAAGRSGVLRHERRPPPRTSGSSWAATSSCTPRAREARCASSIWPRPTGRSRFVERDACLTVSRGSDPAI